MIFNPYFLDLIAGKIIGLGIYGIVPMNKLLATIKIERNNMHEEFDWKKAVLAHPGKRYQGQFLDGLIAIFLFFGTTYILNYSTIEANLAGFIKIMVPVCYFVFSDALPGGQSLGKKPLGISVISKSTGKPCKLWQSFMRNAFSPVLGVIDAVLIFGKNHQRLGDKFANTIVIKNG